MIEEWAVNEIAKLEVAIVHRNKRELMEAIKPFCHEGVRLEEILNRDDGECTASICSHSVTAPEQIDALVALAHHCVRCYRAGQGGC